MVLHIPRCPHHGPEHRARFEDGVVGLLVGSDLDFVVVAQDQPKPDLADVVDHIGQGHHRFQVIEDRRVRVRQYVVQPDPPQFAVAFGY